MDRAEGGANAASRGCPGQTEGVKTNLSRARVHYDGDVVMHAGSDLPGSMRHCARTAA